MNDDPIIAAVDEVLIAYTADSSLDEPVARLAKAVGERRSIWPWRSPDAPPENRLYVAVLFRSNSGSSTGVCEAYILASTGDWLDEDGDEVENVIGWLPLPGGGS